MTKPAPRRHDRRVDRSVALAVGAAIAAVLASALAAALAIAWVASSDDPRPAVAKASAKPAPRPTAVPVSRARPPAAKAPAAAPGTLTVVAVGDMLFGRSTATLIGRKGGAAPLANVAPLLASADIAFGNLEGAISTAGAEAKWKDVTLRGDPRAVLGLQLAGFDVVSLANNHAFDFGWPAARDTMAALAARRIAPSGVGADAAAAWRPVVVSRRGISAAVLSFTRVLPSGFGAGRSHPGVASAYEEELVVRAIRDAKKRYGRVIASFHWGTEYKDRPNASQIELAHHAVDAGADLVVGHHPHVIQALEVYRGKLIAYSLGDFVFEHYSVKTGESFILGADVGSAGVADITVTPVYLDQQGVPSVVHGKTAQRILGRLKDLSAERGVKLRIDGDVGRVTAGARRP